MSEDMERYRKMRKIPQVAAEATSDKSEASPGEATSDEGPEEAAKERQASERRVVLLISGRPPLPLRRAQVSVTMAEETPREGRTSDLAYS